MCRVRGVDADTRFTRIDPVSLRSDFLFLNSEDSDGTAVPLFSSLKAGPFIRLISFVLLSFVVAFWI
jgi:SOS-response transcriptional repressor LexA